MIGLRKLLSNHNWYTLRTIAYANSKSFNSQLTKAQAINYIVEILTDPATVRRALSDLPVDAHEALQTLLACGGAMPAHRFLDQFGPVRPYRPWRDGSPRAPWRNPVSPAERLWFLGFIFFHSTPEGRAVIVPDDLRPLLPTPPSPAPIRSVAPRSSTPLRQVHHAALRRAQDNAQDTADPILDLAHLLAYLQGREVRPFAERWLTPRPLRALNAGLACPDPAVAEARSELQTGYLRFLHYLAEASGLVDVVGGLLKPTPAAWRWLKASEAARWRTLWDGWQTDLERPPREAALWNRYRFPGQPAFVGSLFETFASLESDRSLKEARMDLSTLARYVRRRCIGAGTLPPEDEVITPLRLLLTGPLFWAGLMRIDSEDGVSFTPWGAWLLGSSEEPPEPPRTEPAALRSVDDDGLVVTLPEPPARPPLRPLVELGLPVRERLTRELTRQRFVSFLAHGLSRAWVIETLRELTAGVLPASMVERLAGWEEWARGLRLRRLTVLSVAEAEMLDQLAGQRTIHRHFLETLSPHHVAVDPNGVERLLGALRRRGHTPLVEPAIASLQPSDAEAKDAGATAHLWLALRTYLDLADLVQLPAVPPVALLDQLGCLLDEDTLAGVTSLAKEAQRRLRDAVDGYTPFPAPLRDVDHAAVRDLIERALVNGDAVEIVYHTAGRGERTRRVVEPLRLEERGGALYLVAYCRLRQDERVFRLDRIETAAVRG